jgi:SNF2 family DNA or RNA helicase
MNLNLITYSNNEFTIIFNYDRILVEAIKRIPGRKYNVIKKHWNIPITSFAQLEEFITTYGFTTDNAAREAIKQVKTRIQMALVAKNDLSVQIDTHIPLRPYQMADVQFLSTLQGALLAEPTGTGKTLTALVTANNMHADRVLYICPASLKLSIQEEVLKWFPDESVTVIRSVCKEREALWRSQSRYTIANYELLLKDKAPFEIPWDLIICDEATRLSNLKSKTRKAVIRLPTVRKIAMTATPVANKPDDIYGIIEWIAPGTLGSWWEFQNRYCVKDYWGGIRGYEHLDELAARIDHLYVRRDKNEILPQLPETTVIDIPVELSESERKLYDKVRKEIMYELTDGETNKIALSSLGSAMVKLLRLKQITDDSRLIGQGETEHSKLDVLKEKLEELISGSDDKIIIFTQFEKMSQILRDELQHLQPFIFTGQVSQEARDFILKEFNSPQLDRRVLIMTEAGSEGLNLGVANIIIHFDIPWSLSKLTQREGRISRMTQTKKMFVYRLIARKTVDEYVLKKIYTKQGFSESILSTDHALTQDEISEILSE